MFSIMHQVEMSTDSKEKNGVCVCIFLFTNLGFKKIWLKYVSWHNKSSGFFKKTSKFYDIL